MHFWYLGQSYTNTIVRSCIIQIETGRLVSHLACNMCAINSCSFLQMFIILKYYVIEWIRCFVAYNLYFCRCYLLCKQHKILWLNYGIKVSTLAVFFNVYKVFQFAWHKTFKIFIKIMYHLHQRNLLSMYVNTTLFSKACMLLLLAWFMKRGGWTKFMYYE